MAAAAAHGFDQGQMRGVSKTACLRSLLLSIRSELLEIGPKVAGFLFVLDAGEDHLGARNLGARILDVVLEGRLAPDDAGVLVGVGIAEAGRAAGMAAVEAVELGAGEVLRAFADAMAY